MMGRVSINREQDADSTAVSNIFIDEYMTEANDAQLKIYLYLLRMMHGDKPTSLSDLAERFNLTEKDVTRALKFWEKRGIITMEFDHNKKLSAIHLEELPASSGRTEPGVSLRREAAPVQERHNAPAPSPAPAHMEEILADRNSSAQNHTGSVDEQCMEQILFIAETYFGRPLSTREMDTLLDIRDSLGFSDALMDYLLQYCIERDKKDIRYIERVAARWKESGYETPEQAKRGRFKYDRRIYEVMDCLGLKNLPTETEAAFVERWISEYKMPIDIIREACGRTVLATQRNRLQYAESILQNWHNAGVTKLSDIKQLDDKYEETKKTRSRTTQQPAAGRTGGRGQSFPQRSYDFQQLEKTLIKN